MSGTEILIVEDNPKNLKLICDVLEFHGFVTRRATSGEEGIEIALKQPHNLILMDIQLPGIDGSTAMQRLKADPRTQHTPIVALTAFAMKGDRERLLAAGFDGYIAKPINIKEIADLVKSYIGASSDDSAPPIG